MIYFICIIFSSTLSQPDYPEVGHMINTVVYLTPSITYKFSKLDIINFKEKMLDLFTQKEYKLELCVYEGFELGIFANESMLDMVYYKESKLVSKLVSFLS